MQDILRQDLLPKQIVNNDDKFKFVMQLIDKNRHVVAQHFFMAFQQRTTNACFKFLYFIQLFTLILFIAFVLNP